MILRNSLLGEYMPTNAVSLLTVQIDDIIVMNGAAIGL